MPEQRIEEKTVEIIKQLKKIKKEKGLTLQDVFELVNPKGIQNVSESTLRRVFSEGSENTKFNYESSIQPIAAVLLGINDDDKFEPEKAREYYEQRNGLQDVVLLHNAEEERLRKHIEEQKEHYHNEVIQLKSIHNEKLLELKAIYVERSNCQEKTISLLESDNEFYKKTIDSLLATLEADRLSKQKLYNEIQKLNDEIKKLKAFHEGD